MVMHPLWKEYCAKSSLHGLHYVVASGRPLIERIVWLFLMIVGTLGIVRQLLASWQQLSGGPVQVVVQNPRLDLHDIDFPAITVCSLNKVNAVKAELIFKRIFGNDSDDETREAFMNSLMALSLMRYPYYNHPLSFKNYINGSVLYILNNEEIVDIMKEVNPSLNDMFSNCCWRGTGYNCSLLFRPQLTEEGFCYSFNSRTSIMDNNSSDMTPPFEGEGGKLEVLRNNAAGKITGIELFMNTPNQNHRLPQDSFRPDGYSVMIHNPYNYPDSSRNVVVVKSYKLVYRIAVTVSKTEGDSSLLHLNEEVRGCTYFEKLNHITADYCLMQCRKAEIFRRCACVPYFMEHNPNETVTCGLQHLECLSGNNVGLRTSSAPKGAKGFPSWSMPNFMPCTCPQPCSYISYDTETVITYPISAAMPNAYPKYFAYIDVSYKQAWAISYMMEAKFGMSDFFVAIGGVAGLLLGCSLVSVIEVVYYCARYVYACFVYKKAKLYPYLP